MTTTYSPSLKLSLLGTGDQSGTWGTTTNNNLGTLLEQAITGVAAINLNSISAYTLTNLNGVSDDARNMCLIFSGTPSAAPTITAPAQNKLYVVVNNTTQNLTMVASGGVTSLVIPALTTAQCYCDAANVSGNGIGFYSAQTTAAGNWNVGGNLTVSGTATITGAISTSGAISSGGAITGTQFNGAGTGLTGTAASLTVANIASGAANQILYQSASSTTGFITAPSVAGTAILYNGTGFVWSTVAAAVASGAVYENTQTITANYTMTAGYNGESVGPIMIASGITVSIPSGSRWAII